MNSTSNTALFNACKQIGLYITVSVLINLCVRLDVRYFNGIPELSFTETLQSLLVLFTIFTFYSLSKDNRFKSGATLITGFFITVFIREADFYFDHIVHGFWKFPALFFTAMFGWQFFSNKTDKQALLVIFSNPKMNKVIAGVIFLMVFSRLFGTGSLWQEVLQEHYIVNVKSVIQEGIELLCYFLIMIGAYETRKSLLS